MSSGNEYRTKCSKLPTGPDANFGERILIPVQLPSETKADEPASSPRPNLEPNRQDCWLASSLQLIAYDNRLGGFANAMLGTVNIDLSEIIPWCDKMKLSAKEA